MSLERNGNSSERGLRLTISHGLGEDLDTCQAGDGFKAQKDPLNGWLNMA